MKKIKKLYKTKLFYIIKTKNINATKSQKNEKAT